MKVVDYAWWQVAPAALVSMGFVGAVRYCSHDPSKNLSGPELKGLRASGLDVGVVFETTANRSAQGFQAGKDDAAFGNGFMDGLGFPDDACLYLATDFDAAPSEVRPYYQGAKAGSKRPTGAYGSFHVVDSLLRDSSILYGWQTAAWSHGQVSSVAHLLQNGFHSSYDSNQVLQTNWGQWKGHEVPPHPIPPIPLPEADVSKFVTPSPPTNQGLWVITSQSKRYIADTVDSDALANIGEVSDRTVYPYPPDALRALPDVAGTTSPPILGP